MTVQNGQRDALMAAADALAAAAAALRTAANESDGIPPRLLSVEDAADALGLGRTVVYRLLTEGRLRSTLIGRRRLISEAAVADFIASQETQTTGPSGPVVNQRRPRPAQVREQHAGP